MKTVKPLATLLILFLLTVPAKAQDLDSLAPLSVDLNLDSRATFEALAGRVGLNVVFAPNYTPKAAQPFRVENRPPPEAFDELARQTTTFWTPWDKRTILVAEDTQQNRRDYLRQFVEVLPVAQKPTAEVLSELQASGFQQVAGVGNKILIRDTAEQIRRASRIANPDAAAPTLDLDGVFVTASRFLRTPESRRAQLRAKVPAPLTLNLNESSQAIYETLAKDAGVNILFGPSFRPVNTRFAVKDVGFFDALDLLAVTTNTFWLPLNENTFMVLDDSQQNRREFDTHSAQTIYYPAGTSPARLNEVMNALRTVLALRGAYQNQSVNAIVLSAPPTLVGLVETVIEELSGEPVRKKVATDLGAMFSESERYFYTAAYDRNRLQVRTKERITFSSNATLREAYDRLATIAGLQILFGPAFALRTVDFHIENVDAIDALDLLALQSRTFWLPLDATTILVLEDTQQNRRNFDLHLLKTIYLPREISVNGINEIMNVLRTAFSLRGIYQVEDVRAILVHDRPQRVALVETLVDHLNPIPLPKKSVQIPTPLFSEARTLGVAAAARPELSLKTFTPISINLNQDVRATYQTLGDLAGIKVTFSPDFSSGGPRPFRLEGVDVLDALDYFSLVTQNGWTVVDRQTILVFPDTGQNRANLEKQIVKTFSLATMRSSNAVAMVNNALRVNMSVRNIQSGDGSITVQETPQRMMMVEKVIESLDRPPLPPDQPETASVRVVLSAYRGETQIRTESHIVEVEVGAGNKTLRLGTEIEVPWPRIGTTKQMVGTQIDARVNTVAEGRYRVVVTISKRERDELARFDSPLREPSLPLFENVTFQGTLVLADGGTARLEGTNSIGDQTWRADVTLSIKR